MIRFLTKKAAAGFSAVNKFLRKKKATPIVKFAIDIPEKTPQEPFISMEIPALIQKKPNEKSQKKLLVQKQTSQRKNWSKWKKRL